MAYVKHELSFLVQARPKEARERIWAAYVAAAGHEERTARALGVAVRTLDRWTTALGLAAKVARLRTIRREQAAKVRAAG